MPSPTVITEEIATLTRKMRTVFDKIVAKKGLTLSRARILRRLRLAGSRETQRALAEDLDIESPTLVRLLDSLEQRGLIQRIAVESDRRAKHILLTEAGERQAEAVEAVAETFRADILQGIDPAEVRIARKVLAEMQKNLAGME
eukprot:gene65800-biopygen48226